MVSDACADIRRTCFEDAKRCSLMSPSTTRALVVDDYEPFRRFVCSILDVNPELQVIGEASDGLEAVGKAKVLQPDLIVLDIGLPTLNGIEAAWRIRRLSPNSKIIFVSQESSADVVQEAFHLGAQGYVAKAHAGTELLAAVETVRQGGRFVSRGLSGEISDASDMQAAALHLEKTLPSLLPKKADITSNHEAHFYPDDASFVVGMAGFIEAELSAGNSVIVVTTKAHRKNLLERLQARGVDFAAAIDEGTYIPLDVEQTLSTFMVNNLPDKVRFLEVACDLVATAAKAAKGEHPRVAACGECAPLLWAQGNGDAAIQLEHLWDHVAATYGMHIQCGYVLKSSQHKRENLIYARICAEHSAVCSH